MKLRRWSRLLVLAIFAVMTFTGASWPLQPLVEVKTSRASAAPQGCDESLAPAPSPRLEVKQIPEPEPIVAVALAEPPSGSLRSGLEAAHRALATNDRPAFDEHLRTARAILAGYPPGGERTAAEEVVRVFDDAARVWDAQFQSPFFDERSDVYARASRYPGYAEAVRRSMLTDDADRRYYPAGESREFLTRIAAERLPRVGVRTQTRIARTEPSRTPASTRASRETARVSPSPRQPSSAPKRASVPKQAERTTLRPRSYTPSRSSSRTTISRKAPTPARSMPTPAAPRGAAQNATEPARPPARVAVPRTAVTAPPPEKTTTTSPAIPTDTYATTTATAVTPIATTQTTATVATPTATATSAPIAAETAAPEVTQSTATDAAAPERRSIVVPFLLILIGLGVLILLFRAAN